MAETTIIMGFKGLEFSTGIDQATNGKLAFVIKDLPTNADKHALMLGAILNEQLVFTLDNGSLSVAIRERNRNANNPKS